MSGRPINESRQLAILMGDKTYTGAAHDRCGTTERYVKGGGCVHCARVIATEQRDARKFLAAAEATAAHDAADRHVIDDTFADPVVRADHQAELDDADEAVHQEMVADARDEFRDSIDALM